MSKGPAVFSLTNSLGRLQISTLHVSMPPAGQRMTRVSRDFREHSSRELFYDNRRRDSATRWIRGLMWKVNQTSVECVRCKFMQISFRETHHDAALWFALRNFIFTYILIKSTSFHPKADKKKPSGGREKKKTKAKRLLGYIRNHYIISGVISSSTELRSLINLTHKTNFCRA